MIKDILDIHKRLDEAAKKEDGGEALIKELNEFGKVIAEYAEKGKELVLKTVKDEDFAGVRTAMMKTIEVTMLSNGNPEVYMADKNGLLVEFTDTIILAMIAILCEEGAL